MKNVTDSLGTGKILPLTFKLVIPAVIAQLITFIYNVVDRMFVSGIKDVATDALAALGVCLPITIIISAFSNLIGLGASPKASMNLGNKNEETANKIFNNSVFFLFVIGVILTLTFYFGAEPILKLFGCPTSALPHAVDYLKIYSLGAIFIIFITGLNPFISAQGYSFISMGTILIGALINIGLDPLFIYVLNMGVKGASLATVLSQIISFIWLISFFISKKSIFRFNFKKMIPDFKMYLGCFFLGLSPFIMTITESLIQIVFNNCLKISTGGDSSTYTAALTIMLSALQFISLPLNGLGYGIAPFISYNYGKKDPYRIKKGIKYTFIIGVIFTVIVYTISMAFPEIYSYIFQAEDEVSELIKMYMPLFLMGTIMFCIQMTLQNINVALGQGLSAVLLAVFRKVILLIPLCFILTYTIGFKGVYLSEGISDLIAGIITGIVIFITFRKILKKLEIENKEQSNSESLN